MTHADEIQDTTGAVADSVVWSGLQKTTSIGAKDTSPLWPSVVKTTEECERHLS